jgi:hypothetical protein
VRRGLIALLLLLAFVPAASADGDPASDTLLVQNTFLPYPRPPASLANALSREVAIAYAHGYRLKVAVIASETDLGAVPSLFNKPADYAKFLGQELEFYYIGPLLVVMPAGYGVYDGGRTTLKERKVLASLHPSGSSGDALTASATSVVHALVAKRALVSKDIKAPYAAALQGSATPGEKTKLPYAVFDDSSRTSERLAVRDSQDHVLAKWSIPLKTTVATKTYTVEWNVPSTIPMSGLKFCLTAFDPSGNHSENSCAPIVVKA